MRKLSFVLLLSILVAMGICLNFCTSCSSDIILYDEEVALASTPPTMPYTPEHPGTLIQENEQVIIDYSNSSLGYVMVYWKTPVTIKLKAQVKGPNSTYTYNIASKEWTAFSLSDGNGNYTIRVLKNTAGTKYAQVLSCQTAVSLKNEFSPFLYSNQYVCFSEAPNTIAKAKELIGEEKDTLNQIKTVYEYVTDTLSYDYEKAKNVQSGYLPKLDEVLAQKKGICFDYAALMAGMLRSQGVPCKLVIGYAGTTYHAWISVYTEEYGWVNGAIYFDGETWHRMDPTFDSTGKSSETIMKYIQNDSNYTTKYLY